jgi:hypothetical protein
MARVKSDDGALSWDLWIDFHGQGADGLTPALVEHARPGVNVEAGSYLLVGSADSELAVARIVSVDPDGVVQARVLPGPAQEHLHLIEPTGAV